MSELSDLYPELIRDHDKKPRNFRVMADADRSAEGHNPLCGDRYTVFLKLENGMIRDAAFHGSGCCISKASASMMTDFIKGKSVADAQKLFTEFQHIVTTGKGDEEAMGKLCAFSGVHTFPMRVKCAILPWHALLAGLRGEASATTEEK